MFVIHISIRDFDPHYLNSLDSLFQVNHVSAGSRPCLNCLGTPPTIREAAQEGQFPIRQQFPFNGSSNSQMLPAGVPRKSSRKGLRAFTASIPAMNSSSFPTISSAVSPPKSAVPASPVKALIAGQAPTAPQSAGIPMTSSSVPTISSAVTPTAAAEKALNHSETNDGPALSGEMIAKLDKLLEVSSLTPFGQSIAHLIAEGRFKDMRFKAYYEFQLIMATVLKEMNLISWRKGAIVEGKYKVANFEDGLVYLKAIARNADIEDIVIRHFTQNRSKMWSWKDDVIEKATAGLTPELIIMFAKEIDSVVHDVYITWPK